jgi:hypothetical protein
MSLAMVDGFGAHQHFPPGFCLPVYPPGIVTLLHFLYL